jgi:hypothetical protein
VWISLIGALVGAGAALGGVFLTTRAADRREHRNRLWDKRAEIFVAAVKFLYDIRLDPPPASRDDPDPQGHWARYTALQSQLAVFADRELQEAFRAAARPASYPNYYDENKPAWGPVTPFEDLVHRSLAGAAPPKRTRILAWKRSRLIPSRFRQPPVVSPSYFGDYYGRAGWPKRAPKDDRDSPAAS